MQIKLCNHARGIITKLRNSTPIVDSSRRERRINHCGLPALAWLAAYSRRSHKDWNIRKISFSHSECDRYGETCGQNSYQSDLSIICSKIPAVTHGIWWKVSKQRMGILHSKDAAVATATSDRNTWTKLIQKWSAGWSRHLLKQDYGHQLLGLHPNGQSDREVIFPRWTERAKEEQSQQITGIAKDWDHSLVQFSSVTENFVGAHTESSKI